MKKIIFLDIDGVLNSDNFFTDRKSYKQIDSNAIELLNQLYSEDTEIVISSSWGTDGIQALTDNGCEIPIIGVTEHFHNDFICRGNEILHWLTKNGYSVSKFTGESYNNDVKYVIIDDDTDMLLSQKNFFVQTDRDVGIIQEDIDKCKKILEL